MRAARWHARGDIRIEDIPEPELRPGTWRSTSPGAASAARDLHEYLEGPIFIPPPGTRIRCPARWRR